jgi:8-oxo-dGTP diphosphatase
MDAISEIHSHWSSGSTPPVKGSPEVTAQSVAQLSFPGWETPTRHKAPLDLEKVQAIYDCINWSFAVDKLDQQGRQYGTYGEKTPISMCKALALPYLTFIPSLAELAVRLVEYDAYRVVCGFRGRPPTRAMLWHFQYAPLPGEKRRRQEGKRDKEKNTWFYEILYHILIRAVIVGDRLDFDLPFHYIEDVPELLETDDKLPSTTLKLQEYPNLEIHLVHRKQEYFPVQIRVFDLEQPVYSYVMRPPPWWGEEKDKQSYHDEGSESRSVRQYTACSAIIPSDNNKVLLGKRKTGYKPGHYALPGGRWKFGETLRECVEREIKEETGLEVVDLRPVSISFNRYQDGHQECWSLGALVTEFKGQVMLREPERCEGWGWYDLDALPQPLFRPSQIIIDDYRFRRFPNITWEQIEDWIEKTQKDNAEPTPTAQLRLLL